MFVKIANELKSFRLFVCGGSVDSTSEDDRAFLKEPEFYPVKCVGCFLKAVFFSKTIKSN